MTDAEAILHLLELSIECRVELAALRQREATSTLNATKLDEVKWRLENVTGRLLDAYVDASTANAQAE